MVYFLRSLLKLHFIRMVYPGLTLQNRELIEFSFLTSKTGYHVMIAFYIDRIITILWRRSSVVMSPTTCINMCIYDIMHVYTLYNIHVYLWHSKLRESVHAYVHYLLSLIFKVIKSCSWCIVVHRTIMWTDGMWRASRSCNYITWLMVILRCALLRAYMLVLMWKKKKRFFWRQVHLDGFPCRGANAVFNLIFGELKYCDCSNESTISAWQVFRWYHIFRYSGSTVISYHSGSVEFCRYSSL